VRRARTFTAKAIYAARLLARDDRIPKPLRWLVLIGLLPIPGPFDEAILLATAPFLFIFGREPMRDAWLCAETERFASRLAGPPRAS
jgi:hypothetical protein